MGADRRLRLNRGGVAAEGAVENLRVIRAVT
jgi:hypothetical protein